MSKSKTASLLCLPACTVAHAAQRGVASRPISFTRLAAGEEIHIGVSSYGDDGPSSYMFDFLSQPTPRVRVTELSEHVWEDPKALQFHYDPPRGYIGTVLLLPVQVQRLNNLLAFYRSRAHRARCSETDTIMVSDIRNGKTQRREKYVDNTCGTDVLDAPPSLLHKLKIYAPPVLQLWHIVSALNHCKPKPDHPLVVSIPDPDPNGSEVAVEQLQERLDMERAKALAPTLPGYDAIRSRFQITNASLGHFVPGGYSLSIDVAERRAGPLTGAVWYDPMVAGRPRYGWSTFLKIYREAERAAASHYWLADWHNAGAGRTVTAEIVGSRAHSQDDIHTNVFPAWKHAGLRGVPEFELTLYGGSLATVYLGKSDPRALITSAYPLPEARCKHWLDGISVYYDPKQVIPQYVVVTPGGQWRINTRPK